MEDCLLLPLSIINVDIKKHLHNTIFYESVNNVVVFSNSDIKNTVDFFLKCKLVFYNAVTNEFDSEVHDIIQGLKYFLIKAASNKPYIFQFIREKVKVAFDEAPLNSSILIISIKDHLDSNFTGDVVNVKILDICSTANTNNLIRFLVDFLYIEERKFHLKIYQEDRSFYTKLACILPVEVREYSNQVGGHGLIFGEEMKILQYEKIVFKPVQQFPKGRTEISFYEKVFASSKGEDLHNFQKFVPKYFGLFYNSLNLDHDLYIGLEDVLANFINPSIADIKLGLITYEPDAEPGKIAVEKAKYFWREEVGFLFTGIRVIKSDDKDDIFLDRYHGLSLDPDMVFLDGILTFLSGYSDRYFLAQLFKEKLNDLLKWLEGQKHYNFYSSSLLLAYDRTMLLTNHCGLLVKMIDFTHSRLSDERDFNCIFGLKSLISYFGRVESSC